ncbi:MAG: hypothetical protein ABJD07_14685, partial [Gemmatimonadaceae bacterium]
PTDCPTAIRNRPPNARVIFGDDARQPSVGRADRTTDVRSPRADTAVRPREPATLVTPASPRIDERTRRPPEHTPSDDPREAAPRFTPQPLPTATPSTTSPPRAEPRPQPPQQPLPRDEPQQAPPPRADPTPSRRPDLPDLGKRPVPRSR